MDVVFLPRVSTQHIRLYEESLIYFCLIGSTCLHNAKRMSQQKASITVTRNFYIDTHWLCVEIAKCDYEAEL